MSGVLAADADRFADPAGIHAQILAFLESCRDRDARVVPDAAEALAEALAGWQRDHNAAYGALAAAEVAARPPDDPRRGRAAIPSVPVALFRDLPLTTFPPERAGLVFRTSGTTGQVRGEHRLLDDRLYAASAAIGFARRVPHAPRRVVSLCPPGPGEAPGADSSLGHMVRLFADELVPCFRDGALDAARAWEALRAPGPTFLATTAFALDALLQADGRAELDERSLVMVTGGFKGRRVRLDADELYRALAPRLGRPRVVGEYGMTELSSQLWTDPVPAGEVPGAFVAPPWLLVYAVDPITTRPVEGEGLLRFVDLANADTVAAIETMDLGVVERHPDGDRVWLRGRVEGAEARGCSLRAEDLLDRAKA